MYGRETMQLTHNEMGKIDAFQNKINYVSQVHSSIDRKPTCSWKNSQNNVDVTKFLDT